MWYASFIPAFMVGNCKNIKKLNELENKIETQNTFMQLLNLTLDTYKWEGLPETCNERFLEMMLVTNGWACLRRGEEGIQSLGFLPKSWNIYGEPATGTAFGFFGQAMNSECFVEGSINTNADTVFCRCNMANYPMINYIRIYAARLTDLMRSMDVCAKQLKSPYFIQCEETQVPTIQKVINDQQSNEIAIIASKMLDMDNFKVLPTNVKAESLEATREHYKEIMNMFLMLIGISTQGGNTMKAERMITAEVESNNEITNDYLFEGLYQRQKFAENCNKLFGTNISVSINETRQYQSENDFKQPFADNKKGEDKDENI